MAISRSTSSRNQQAPPAWRLAPLIRHCTSACSLAVVVPCVILLVVKSLGMTKLPGSKPVVMEREDRSSVSFATSVSATNGAPTGTTGLQAAVRGAQNKVSLTFNVTPSVGKKRKRKRQQPNLSGGGSNKATKNMTDTVRSIPRHSYNFTDIVLRNNLSRPFASSFLMDGIESRPSPPADRSQSWCIPSTLPPRSTRRGLFYNKMPKSASSTVSGIALRIAQRYAERYYPNATDTTTTIPCNARVGHVPGYKAGQTFGDRDRMGTGGQELSFLFSTLRDPARRALSRIYFSLVSQEGRHVTEDNILSWLKGSTNSQFGSVSPGMGGFQLAYLAFRTIDEWAAWSSDAPYRVRDVELVHEVVREIMSDYDHLILVERFDEGLVVLQLLLGLEAADILYLSSKHAGNYYYSPRRNECIKLVQTESSPTIDSYLQSAEWMAMSYGDYVLHEAVNLSLDLTIDDLGRDRFNEALDAFLELKNLAEEQCADEAVFPCSATGEVQLARSAESCYDKDWGCGYPCLDSLTIGTK